MEKKKLSLPVQIVIALILGIAAGLIFYFIGKPEFTTNYLKPFGTIFVNLLKFIVVPVVLPPFVKQKNLLHRFTFARIGAPRLYSSPPFVVH